MTQGKEAVMADRDFILNIDSIATDIALWQGVALELPVCEVRDLVSPSQHGLADSLTAFNQVYLDDQHTDDALAAAVSEVIRRATATAIFTLGATWHTHRTAPSN
jgi:hypothetical protein